MRGLMRVRRVDDLVEGDVAFVAIVEDAAADAHDEVLLAGEVVGQPEARREQDAVVLDQVLADVTGLAGAQAVGDVAAVRHDAADERRGERLPGHRVDRHALAVDVMPGRYSRTACCWL